MATTMNKDYVFRAARLFDDLAGIDAMLSAVRNKKINKSSGEKHIPDDALGNLGIDYDICDAGASCFISRHVSLATLEEGLNAMRSAVRSELHAMGVDVG